PVAGEIGKICKMVEEGDLELRCAAAKVLGELKPKEKQAIAALTRALSEDNDVLRRYVLEAIGKIKDKTFIPALLPLLGNNGGVRVQAVDALASFGSSIVAQVKSLAKSEDSTTRHSAIEVLVKLKSKSSLRALFDVVRETEFPLSHHIAQHASAQLEQVIPTLTPSEKDELYEVIQDALAQDETHATLALMALRALSVLQNPQSTPTLLRFTQPEWTSPVRAQAMTALRHLHIADADVPAVAAACFALLNDRDFPHIVKPALDLLYRLPLADEITPQLEECLRSRYVEVKNFAVRKLGHVNSDRAIALLLQCLNDSDAIIRDLAQHALLRQPAVVPQVLKQLEEATSDEQRQGLLPILRAHAASFTKATIHRLVKQFLTRLHKGDESYRAYLDLLRRAAPEAALEPLLDEADAHLKAQRYGDAVKTLSALSGTELFTEEVQYRLALAHLKQSRKDLALASRQTDPALRLFGNLLVRHATTLAERLKQDKLLEPEDLFYLGFHFAERSHAEKTFGAAMLQHIARHYARRDLGKAAKKKLQVEGLESQ
ncbi:MAG: HEAT repeat domain-containing protein, partial [Abditibacteriales bacterium]|nr:HEAT repeat domain-containing protein [Abditibacteriales bacterium]MDW8365489.1 HEAT repeat domain-containing protein [Abditibacteriales bacterium]